MPCWERCLVSAAKTALRRSRFNRNAQQRALLGLAPSTQWPSRQGHCRTSTSGAGPATRRFPTAAMPRYCQVSTRVGPPPRPPQDPARAARTRSSRCRASASRARCAALAVASTRAICLLLRDCRRPHRRPRPLTSLPPPSPLGATAEADIARRAHNDAVRGNVATTTGPLPRRTQGLNGPAP